MMMMNNTMDNELSLDGYPTFCFGGRPYTVLLFSIHWIWNHPIYAKTHLAHFHNRNAKHDINSVATTRSLQPFTKHP